MSRVERLFGMARFLQQKKGRTISEIEAEFSISERTVFRDLAALEESGVPIVQEDGRYRVYQQRPLAVSFDSGEVALVRVALSDPALRRAGPLGRRLGILIDKLEEALRGRREPPALTRLAGPESSASDTEPVMSELERLAREGRPAIIRYHSLSGGVESDRGVDPWQIFHRAGAWYLVGRCHLHDETRLFRLDRVRAVRPGEGAFRRPEEFELERFLSDAWSIYVGPERHDVHLVFDGELAEAIEGSVHHDGEIKERKADGSIDYRVTISDLEEIARWVVGFGGACRVIAPTELRALARRLASGVLASEWKRRPATRRKRR